MSSLFDRYDSFAEKAAIPSRLAVGDPARCPEPRISVIMPVFRRPELFALALQSVLAQDYQESYEVVVVDNNEEENSPNQLVVEQAGSDKVLYYRHAENLGMSGNWNRGIELARAPYVTFCHDDDLLLPLALRRLMTLQSSFGDKCILSAYNTVDAAGTVIGTTAYGRRIGLLAPRSCFPYSRFLQLLGNVTCGNGSLYARRCLLATGGFNDRFYPVADYAMNVLYTNSFGGMINNVPTAGYRVALNESISIYRDSPTLFADQTRKYIHEGLKTKIRFPGRWVDRLIRILYKNNVWSGTSFWDEAGGDEVSRLSVPERLTMRILLNVSRLIRYEWVWARHPGFPETPRGKR